METGRTRRSSAVVRDAVLAAAREVFTERGFAGARTREIAARADVTEKVMFRHFPSKVDLFQAAVFEPFQQFVDAFLAEFDQRVARGLSAEQLAGDYVRMLFDFLTEHRSDVLSLLAAYAHDPEVLAVGEGPGPLDRLLDELAAAVVVGLEETGLKPPNPRHVVRLTFGMVLSATVSNPLLFGDDGTGPEELVEELTQYVIGGVLRRDRPG